MKHNVLGFFILLLVFSGSYLKAQEIQSELDELKKQAPKVFIDCRFCDIDYIRTEITFVNYVWDRKEADVHVLVTRQNTGSGGREYTLAFLGLREYADFQNTLKYVSGRNDTQDETRIGLTKVLKMGLVAIAARTPISQQINVAFKDQVKATAVEDKWDFWVFSIGVHSFLNGQKSNSSSSIYGNLSANRVTPASKLRLGLSANWDESVFRFDEDEISSSAQSRSFSGLYVRSLTEHWSIGSWLDINYSTYSNIRLGITPSPAIEYNFFPYSESTRRQLRLLYRLKLSFFRYMEETIYDEKEESLWGQSLSATLELKETWGSIETTLTGSNFFHDFDKYRLQFYSNFRIRLLKGLNLNIFGSYSRIHDQIALRKGEASFEEVLLRRRELATDYSYFFSIGLNFSFGSIFSNVVNPRFGSRGGGGIIFR